MFAMMLAQRADVADGREPSGSGDARKGVGGRGGRSWGIGIGRTDLAVWPTTVVPAVPELLLGATLATRRGATDDEPIGASGSVLLLGG